MTTKTFIVYKNKDGIENKLVLDLFMKTNFNRINFTVNSEDSLFEYIAQFYTSENQFRYIEFNTNDGILDMDKDEQYVSFLKTCGLKYLEINEAHIYLEDTINKNIIEELLIYKGLIC